MPRIFWSTLVGISDDLAACLIDTLMTLRRFSIVFLLSSPEANPFFLTDLGKDPLNELGIIDAKVIAGSRSTFSKARERLKPISRNSVSNAKSFDLISAWRVILSSHPWGNPDFALPWATASLKSPRSRSTAFTTPKCKDGSNSQARSVWTPGLKAIRGRTFRATRGIFQRWITISVLSPK